MTSTVQQLIDSGRKIVTVARDDTAHDALKLMMEHDYSQLPVTDREGKIVAEKGKGYMITSDSILRALNLFGTGIKDVHLRVADAMVKTTIFREDSDLFELLNDLQDAYAVLIADREQKLVGIVTSYDATEYFRQRAENMMLVEDIEEAIKKYILVAFLTSNGETNDELTKAIESIMPSNRDLQAKFQKALVHYLKLKGEDNVKLQKDLSDQAFSEYIYTKEATKPFDRLTLNQYIEMFTHESRWERYQNVFSLERKHVRNLLDNVRSIRNDLAHFRSTISNEQHRTLVACKEWLEHNENEVLKEFEPTQLNVNIDMDYATLAPEKDEIIPVEESIQANESRYAPLAQFLVDASLSQQQISRTFGQIEEIIGGALPDAARQHRSWWANDPVGHVQSQQWLDVDWRVSRINMTDETVVFSHIQEREKAYIDFFSQLIQQMRDGALYYKRRPNPDGTSWMTFAWIPEVGSPLASLVFSFARYGRFRVELYIDTRDKERNKEMFDNLYQRRQVIMAELGELSESLVWERIDDKRASRIALYHRGAITDEKAKLSELGLWAVEAMKRFQPIMEKYVREVL